MPQSNHRRTLLSLFIFSLHPSFIREASSDTPHTDFRPSW